MRLLYTSTIKKKLRDLSVYEKVPLSSEELLKLGPLCPEVLKSNLTEESDDKSTLTFSGPSETFIITRLRNLSGENYIVVQHESERGTWKWEKYFRIMEENYEMDT